MSGEDADRVSPPSRRFSSSVIPHPITFLPWIERVFIGQRLEYGMFETGPQFCNSHGPKIRFSGKQLSIFRRVRKSDFWQLSRLGPQFCKIRFFGKQLSSFRRPKIRLFETWTSVLYFRRSFCFSVGTSQSAQKSDFSELARRPKNPIFW